MSKIFPTLLCASALLLSGVAVAAELKVAVVDPMAAINGTEQYTKAMADLEKDLAADKAKLTKLQAELNTCRQKMGNDAATMSATDAAKLKSDCETKFRDFQSLGQTFQRTVNERQQAILQDISPKLQRALDAIAKEGNYDLVLTREVVLFGKPVLDITDKLILKINGMK